MEVRREVLVDAEPDRVWEALTEPDLLERWLAPKVELEPREGGQVRVRDSHGSGRTGVIERLDEPHELALRWYDDHGVESRVEIRVDAVAGGSQVRVIESSSWSPVAATMASVTWGMRAALLAVAARPAVLA